SINTSGNEEGPFLSTTGDTLYFASDKLPGWGGYDLFYSVRGKFGHFGAPVNMGQPYNTPDDDIFLQWIPGSRGGLMASNRKGGQGDMDIYRIEHFGVPAPEICNEFTNKKFNVVLDASESLDPDGAHLVYEWMLKSGEVLGYGLKIEYTFEHPGVYDIILNAIDPVLNVVDVRDTSLSVVIDSINHIAWKGSKTIYAGDSVLLDASISYMAGRKLKHCFWETNGVKFGGNSLTAKMTWDSAGMQIVKCQIVMTCDTCFPIRYCYTDTIRVLPAGNKATDSLLAKNRFLAAKTYLSDSVSSNQLTNHSGKGVTVNHSGNKTADTAASNNTSGQSSATTVAGNGVGQNQSSGVGTTVTAVPPGAISLPPVYFDFDKWAIRADAQLSLDSIVALLKANPDAVLYIEGHTDVRGTNTYNQRLSAKRVNAVKNELVKAGISGKRIVRVNALGEMQPAIKCAADACSESNHQLNRRVELQIIVK
ncbi:MAG: OmpA family protein, partial [Bacteroidia bacterium]